MSALKRKSAKTDPELIRQMAAASESDNPVVGVFRITPEDPEQLVNSPTRTKELAQRVLERVHQRIGYAANRYNVLGNLGVVVVSARPPFLEELRHEPEIASAIANEQPGSAMIEPVKKRDVSHARGADGRGKKMLSRKKLPAKQAKVSKVSAAGRK